MAKNTKGFFKMEMLLLKIISEGDCYGYQIVQTLDKISNGTIHIAEGTMYPILYRLLDEGLISDEKRLVGKRQTRIYYHIEDKGITHMQKLYEEYLIMINSIKELWRTNMKMNRNLNKYIKDCKHFFPFLSKNEKIFLKRLKVNIVENIDSTNITYDDLCNKFGYPSDIIISYFEDQDANYLIKQSRIRNILKKAIIICTVAILVCCLWRGILIYKSYHDSKNSKVKHIEYTIEEVN